MRFRPLGLRRSVVRVAANRHLQARQRAFAANGPRRADDERQPRVVSGGSLRGDRTWSHTSRTSSRSAGDRAAALPATVFRDARRSSCRANLELNFDHRPEDYNADPETGVERVPNWFAWSVGSVEGFLYCLRDSAT